MYFIVKKLFESARLMLSGTSFIPCAVSYQKVTYLERSVITNFETEVILVCTHYYGLCLIFLFLVVTYLLFTHFFFFLLFLFISFFLAVLGLHFRARAFSSCGKRGPPFIAVRGPLTIVASLVAEHRLQMCRLSSCGPRA